MKLKYSIMVSGGFFMRTINANTITNAVYKCCVDAAYFIDDSVLNKIISAKDKETDLIAKNILCQIIEN